MPHRRNETASGPIEHKPDALTIVAIESVEVHEIRKLRRTTGDHLVVVKPASRVAREFDSGFLRSLCIRRSTAGRKRERGKASRRCAPGDEIKILRAAQEPQ